MSTAASLVAAVLIPLVLVMGVRTTVATHFVVPSTSMSPTLKVGDHLLATVYDKGEPERGDVVVFADPDHWLGDAGPSALRRLLGKANLTHPDDERLLGKRVIGVGGDHVVASTDFDVVVPPGHLWVMGITAPTLPTLAHSKMTLTAASYRSVTPRRSDEL